MAITSKCFKLYTCPGSQYVSLIAKIILFCNTFKENLLTIILNKSSYVEVKNMDHLKLTTNKISIDEITNLVTSSDCGAISLFIGTTKDNFEVINLEYKAYENIYKSLKTICSKMRDKWKNIINIGIYHRLGDVPTGESSVVIAIASLDHVDALEATQWCINTLKKTVPIWKKEVYDSSSSESTENKECKWLKKIKAFKMADVSQLIPVETSNVPPHLIQITCSSADLNKRIRTFIERKREQVNYLNIKDFCGDRSEDSCARVSAKLSKHKNSKTHLKVARVFNTYGPRSNLTDKSSTQLLSNTSNPIEQRLKDLESKLNICKPVPRDVYARLKQMEDRLLELEAISPEYANFWNTNLGSETELNKQSYSVNDIDQILMDLEVQAN